MKSLSGRIFKLRALSLIALVTISIAVVKPATAQTFQAKVWIVSVPQAATVAFPAPSATPDVTFKTNSIAYIGQDEQCMLLSSFLSTCSTPTVPKGSKNGLQFSGLPNPNLGNKPAVSSTAMYNSTYGELIEFTGTVNLTSGQEIQILHDDGVALEIDGVLITGFGNHVTAPTLESVTFTGTTGPHSIDLLYGNTAGDKNDGAWLLFFPRLY